MDNSPEIHDTSDPGPSGTADSLPPASDSDIAALLGVNPKVFNKPASGGEDEGDEPPAAAVQAHSRQLAKPRADTSAQQTAGAATVRPNALARAVAADEAATAANNGVAPPKGSRDLEGFDEPTKQILRKMGNEAFAYVKPLLDLQRQHKDLPGHITNLTKERDEALGQRWFDHPESYTLTEEYQNINTVYNKVAQVEQFWRGQLAKIRSGETEVRLYAGLDEKTGELMVTAPQAVTPTLADNINEYIALAKQDLSNLEQQRNGLKESHGKQWSGYRSFMDKLYEDNFKPHEALLKERADFYMKSFPPFFRRDPVARILAYQQASSEFVSDKLEQTRAAGKMRKATQQAAQMAGPTQDEIETGATGGENGVKTLTQKEFNDRYMVGVG